MLFAICGGVAALLAVWLYTGFLQAFGLLFSVALLYGLIFHTRWCYVALKTAPRDIGALLCYAKMLLLIRKLTWKNWSIPDVFHETVQRHPDKPCFLYQDEVWTFKEAEDFSLKVTAVLKAQGLKKGDVVALLVNNCPQYPCFWMGISRLGAVAPLINTNQRGNALLHSINIANCNAVIFSSDHEDAITDISGQLDPKIKLYKFAHKPLNPSSTEDSSKGNIRDINALLEKTEAAPWALSDGPGFHGKLLYIYTSGTTGLPKAAVISSSRFVFMAAGLHYLGSMNSSDTIYCPLPLYHTAGGVISVGNALLFGCTVAIKSKFSASQYFPDCVKYKATVAHYIGEMCRYILATKPSPSDTQHNVRVIFGNGMRPQIWNDFVKRFNISRVAEFYGATEGNANIVNVDNKPGAIGFISRIIPQVYPIAIIKVDQLTGEPIRNAQGFCQLAQPEEPGVFIGKISPSNPTRAFLGYVDKSASEKKIVRDVFTLGDSAFLSGDILVADELGYLYFKDRTGDTFRWRGENVSTTEVEAAVSRCAQHRDAVVYGVLVEGVEGRAGMCGLVDTDGTLNLDQLAKDLTKDLPSYARPVFIRVMTSVDMTGTFKMKKIDLQKEGYDPTIIKDKLYFLDTKLSKYLPLGPEEFTKINNGQIRI